MRRTRKDDPPLDAPPAQVVGSYWRLARTHTYSLLFALPLLVLYEALTLGVNRTAPLQVRNYAELVLRRFLAAFGAHGSQVFFGLVIVVAAALVIREQRAHPVRLRRWVFGVMAVESLAWALVFGAVVSRLTAALLSPLARVGGGDPSSTATLVATTVPQAAGAALTHVADGWLGRAFDAVHVARPLLAAGLQIEQLTLAQQLVLSLGAGLYEELLFRVLLVTAFAAIARQIAGLDRTPSALVAVVASAAVFSAFHYVGPLGDDLEVASFTYRFLGGLVFSGIYVTRGFGIVAWSHALYDVLLMLSLAAAG